MAFQHIPIDGRSVAGRKVCRNALLALVLKVDVAEASGTTIIMVTHDIEESIFLADKIVFLSSHPGRLREEIVPAFKPAARIRNKEHLLELPGYGEMERKIMRMMREESERT